MAQCWLRFDQRWGTHIARRGGAYPVVVAALETICGSILGAQNSSERWSRRAVELRVASIAIFVGWPAVRHGVETGGSFFELSLERISWTSATIDRRCNRIENIGRWFHDWNQTGNNVVTAGDIVSARRV